VNVNSVLCFFKWKHVFFPPLKMSCISNIEKSSLTPIFETCTHDNTNMKILSVRLKVKLKCKSGIFALTLDCYNNVVVQFNSVVMVWMGYVVPLEPRCRGASLVIDQWVCNSSSLPINIIGKPRWSPYKIASFRIIGEVSVSSRAWCRSVITATRMIGASTYFQLAVIKNTRK